MRVAMEVCSVGPLEIVGALFEDRFGGRDDYYAALESVWGWGTRRTCETAVQDAEVRAEFPASFMDSRIEPPVAGAYALLMTMPEPDFRLAVENILRLGSGMRDAAPRLTKICRSRGAPWAFTEDHGFEWVGDELIEREVIRPALSALNDHRFAGGVRAEFESARNELRTGTPIARKQAVYESGCAIESAMKVLLDEHGVAYDQRDTAQKLFNHLVASAIVPREMERAVLGAATPRNKKGGHGAGAIPHDVSPEQAEAVVAAAAGSIAYLGKLLP
jgi:hypothetical protein